MQGPSSTSGSLRPTLAPEAEARRLDALFALKRSRARRDILRFLVEKGPCYSAHLARSLGLDLPATLGALRGLGTRYAKERSLVDLGLVEGAARPGGARVRVYSATPQGFEVFRQFQERWG